MLKKNENTLTPKQAQFVALLLSGLPIKVCAKQVGVSERTAHTWLSLTQIKQELAAGTESILASARLRADVLGAQAVSVLATLMLSSDVPPQVRVTAARALAARVLDAPAQAEIEVRPGIDYSLFEQSELDVIYPLFAAAEARKKQA